MILRRSHFLIFILCLSIDAFGQGHGHGPAGASDKNFRFSLLGGPGFNPDMGFLLGGDAVFTFSTNPADSTMRRSVIPVAFAYFFNGGGLVTIRPQLFFNHDRFRVFGSVRALNVVDNYYGVGFDTGSEVERGEETTQHRFQTLEFNPVLLFRWQETDFFLGPTASVVTSQIKEPSEGMLVDETYLRQGGDDSGISFFNSGLGFRLNYDTRDVPANAYKGILCEFDFVGYHQAIGSDGNFSTYRLEYRQFQQLQRLGREKVLAWTGSARFTYGDAPFPLLPTIGSPFDLRGYYAGQFRDRHALYALVEYRHGFEFSSSNKFINLLSKTGFVLWTGVGTITNNLETWEETGVLPNFGAGFRVQLQPRINFRVDVGRDPLNEQNLVYLNVTEAF
ncbi:MAG: BamA/TamA family outer membrane protein [Bacteroidota bacterium]